MTDAERLSDEEFATWFAFYTMRRQLDRALDARLRRDSGISMSEYEILQTLASAPSRRARIRDIAAVTRWENSRVSHQVSRLLRRGFVERLACPGDARASLIHLTAAGHRAVVAARPEHVEAVRGFVFDPLSAEQQSTLRDISERVLEALGGATACPPED